MTQQVERAPIPMIGILPNDDERLRKVIMTNIKKDTTQQELKSWLVEKTGKAVNFGDLERGFYKIRFVTFTGYVKVNLLVC